MSRAGGCDWGDEDFPNQGFFWANRAKQALEGKRGRKALADLREALLALPEKRLISRALCTVGGEKRVPDPQVSVGGFIYEHPELKELIATQGEGVCAVGAYIWHKRVKEGMDPQQAFESLPTLADIDNDAAICDTAYAGRDAGLTYTLAYELAFQNDDDYGALSPKERYAAFLAWIDQELGVPA